MVAVVEDSVKGSAAISLDSGGCERERREGWKGRSGKRKREGKEERRNKTGRITIFLSNVHNWVRGEGGWGGGGGVGGGERIRKLYIYKCCLLLNPS